MSKIINGDSLLKVAKRIDDQFVNRPGVEKTYFTPKQVSTLIRKIYLKSPGIDIKELHREVYSVYIRCAKCGTHVRKDSGKSYNYCPYCGEKFTK